MTAKFSTDFFLGENLREARGLVPSTSSRFSLELRPLSRALGVSSSTLEESTGREVGFACCCCLSAAWLRFFNMEGLSTFSSDVVLGELVLRGDRGWVFRGELGLMGLEIGLEMLLDMTLEILLDRTLEMALESSSNVKLRGLTAPAISSVAAVASTIVNRVGHEKG